MYFIERNLSQYLMDRFDGMILDKMESPREFLGGISKIGIKNIKAYIPQERKISGVGYFCVT